MNECKFYLITDTHFFKNSLGASGEEYDKFMRYEQKCFAETESINRSVFDWLNKADDADIVLIAGDLSFNGEKESHIEFIKMLNSLQESGKQVYIVTADHDCDFEESFAFTEKGKTFIESTKLDELYDLYYNFGFKQAIAVDREHLSYVVQLSDGIRLLALNNDGSIDGKRRFDEKQIEWIKQQTKKAREDKQMMIAMNHYPLLPGQPIFSIIPSSVQDDADSVSTLLADEGVNLVFTGHMHNQSINVKTTEKGNKIYDVCTGSVIADPAVIRLITIPDSKTAVIESISAPDFEWNTNGKTCKQYLSDLFDGMILNILYDLENAPESVLAKFELEDKQKFIPILKKAGKFFNKLTVGGACRLFFLKCPNSIRKMLLKNYITELVRGVFEGNQTFVEGTPKGDVFIKVLKRINPILKRIKIKTVDGKIADLYNILKNSAGNYDMDDYNAVLKLK